MYEAYVTRASDQGPTAGRWDNSEDGAYPGAAPRAAQITGFASYADRSLATKMAATPSGCWNSCMTWPGARCPAPGEFEELRAFARDQFGLESLDAWDIGYYSEKLRQHKYSLSREDLKPYFPEARVLQGLFELLEKLYGLHIEEAEGVEIWHQDVRFFRIFDRSGELRGEFFLDLYARPNKRGGAWMDECRTASAGRRLQHPVAYLTCNLSPPVGDAPRCSPMTR